MPLNEPGWWYPNAAPANPRWIAWALSPLTAVYSVIANRRLAQAPHCEVSVPVICIGNFTVGGTGKTPLALSLVELLQNKNVSPAILSRGYGGRLNGPVWVNFAQHRASDVGDEPLMMARYAPVMVAKDRSDGARAIADGKSPVDLIILDDGLQNPSLKKDLTIAVVDGARGFGNGWLVPSGPLRAAIKPQLEKTDAVVINHGSDTTNQDQSRALLHETLHAHGYTGLIFSASLEVKGDNSWLQGTRILAYCGIGNPARFFETLEHCGAQIASRDVFPDHAPVSETTAQHLLQRAQEEGLQLVTTEKDFARLTGGGPNVAALQEATRSLGVRLKIQPEQRAEFETFVRQVISA